MAVLDATLGRQIVKRLPTVSARTLELWVPAGLLILLVAACFLGPAVLHLPGPHSGSLDNANEGIGTPGHLLGTDALGNDLLSQCLYGGRVSIAVGLGAVALGVLVGGSLGVVAGVYGQWVEPVIMRILDTALAFPALILALAIAAYLGPNERDEIIAIAFFTVPAFGRVARGAVLRLVDREFVLSARISGASRPDILVRHIIPNVAPTVFTYAIVTIAVAMIVEAALSFLGLGIRPPEPSWGNLIQAGQQYLSTEPHMVLVPSVFLFVTVLLLNLVGDALRNRWEVD